MLVIARHMNTWRTNKLIGAASGLCLLAMVDTAFGQSVITRLPHLGGGVVQVYALNNSGALVGFSYTEAGEQHAFLYSGGVMRDLGTLGGPVSLATALNDAGVVVGDSDMPDAAPQRAFVYRGGSLVELSVLEGGQFSSAAFVNTAGDIAGHADGPDGRTRGFLFRNGQMTDIGSHGSGFSTVYGMNASGHLVGLSQDATFASRAFLYDGVTLHDLDTLGGTFSRAWAINDSGVVVGESDNADGVPRAFRYRNGAMEDLGTLGGRQALAYGINNAGQIIGDSTIANDAATHAFLLDGTTMRDLGTLGGLNSYPNALNRHGHVIGDTETAEGAMVPFLWRNGSMVDLNDLLPSDSGWVLYAAFYLNDAGQIVGYGLHNDEFAWYLLTVGNSNTAPEARAGDDQNVQCAGLVRVDASGSTDADQDTLTFEWREGTMVLGSSALLEVTLSEGTHTLTVVVTDAHGATSEDSVTVVVADTTAPTVACPSAQTVAAVANCHAAVPDFAAMVVALDNCSASGALVRSQTPAAGSMVGLGSHVVTVSVADEAGNLADCTVVLIVADTTPPVGDCPAERTVNAGSDCMGVVPDFTAALLATDNCTAAEALVKAQSLAAGTRVAVGTYVVDLTVTDAAGNRSMCATKLHVVSDNTRPSVVCPAGMTANAGTDGKAALPDFAAAATVTDSCSGAAVRSQTPAAGTRLGVGVHTVTVKAVDPAGNEGTCTTTFTVVDVTAPVISSVSVNPNVVTENNSMIAVTVSVVASDNSDPAPVSRIVSITSSEPVTGRGDNTSPDWQVTGNLTALVRAERARAETRVYTITVVCTDASGNNSTATTTVTIVKKGKGGGGTKLVTSGAAAAKKAKKAKKSKDD